MKKTLLQLALALATVLASTPASADDGPWLVRIRPTYLSMANDSDAFTALGINFPSNAVHVNSKWIPEFDVSYSFTPNWVAELVLTVPQTQNVSLAGVGNLGSFKHLPPVLAAQYHFLPAGTVDPYIGAGVNYTLIYGSHLSVAGLPLSLDTHSFGVAGQAGVDIRIAQGVYLNLDAKKVTLSSGVYASGTKLTTATLDPWLLSAGIGWRF